MNNIAIAHKDYDVRGGGEILAEELARTFDCPLYIAHGDPSNQPEGSDLDIRIIKPNSRYHGLMNRGGIMRAIGHCFHWRDNADSELAQYDTIITSGNEPLWWQPRDHQTVIAYTHSPPRFFRDLYHEVDGFIGRTATHIQRALYFPRTQFPDLHIANSDRVARRIDQNWNIPDDQLRIVYPPIPTREYSPTDAPTQDYYVTVSRLDGPKRIEEIVQAFNRSGHELRIAGKGPEKDRLERIAEENIHFEGFVTETRKRELLAGAKGFVFAALNEDFGMSPIEAMAAGTPVLGVNEGFTKYQILDGENGYTFERGVGHLQECIDHFEAEGVEWSDTEIAQFADDRFSVHQFRRGMHEAVKEAQDRTGIVPPWMDATEVDSAASTGQQQVVSDGGAR
ncbi:glycosyltransferase [Haladaptatus salinisoli]|uniref:glycosyltransferase n=1 Tax=Haladaptatus salinisoli TaxID=2884876 RepID=UPI001D09E4C4|nr:glycosyltransferase [Haladaptatus salinisoli]